MFAYGLILLLSRSLRIDGNQVDFLVVYNLLDILFLIHFIYGCPFYSFYYLVWAPHITGQHTKENAKYIYDQLHATDIEYGSRSEIIKKLNDLGEIAKNHR